jgi:hypothetical protein
MFIEFTSGPRTGERAHLKYEIAAPLIAAGIAVEVHLSEEEKKALRFGNFGKPFIIPTPEWNVINSPYTGKLLIQCRCGSESWLFDGKPGKEWKCPPEIVKEFNSRLEREALARAAEREDRDRAVASTGYRG